MRYSQNGKGNGTGESAIDQYALPINPEESATLNVHSIITRNEVTCYLLSRGRILE